MAIGIRKGNFEKGIKNQQVKLGICCEENLVSNYVWTGTWKCI